MKHAIVVRQTMRNGERRTQCLSLYYKWADLPDLIPLWHAPVMLNVVMSERNPQKPTGIAEVDDSGVIDLDQLGIIPL